MLDENQLKELANEANAIRSKRTQPVNNRLSDIPLAVGDVLTFSLKVKK